MVAFFQNAMRLLAALATIVPAFAQQAPPRGWPVFAYQGVVTNKTALKYNPTNEFIFSSVFQAGKYLAAPLAEWYLYYAPHENPGGISLMYSNSLEGPWTEHPANPLITNNWAPHFNVPHVSSPDAIWNTETNKMFMYFHGTNSETRWAWSWDGVTFTYGAVAVRNAMGGPNVTESSYARVFVHPDPSSGYAYAMFYMANEKDNKRRIRLAESKEGKVWTVSTDYVVAPGPLDNGNVSGADLWKWNGQLYVIYHASSGKVFARTIDETLRKVGTSPIILHQSSGKGDDVGRVAAPQVVTDPKGGLTYIFYESGDRLGATIAYAKITCKRV